MDNNMLMDRIAELDQIIDFRDHLMEKALAEGDLEKFQRLLSKQLDDKETKKINEELLHSMGMHH